MRIPFPLCGPPTKVPTSPHNKTHRATIPHWCQHLGQAFARKIFFAPISSPIAPPRCASRRALPDGDKPPRRHSHRQRPRRPRPASGHVRPRDRRVARAPGGEDRRKSDRARSGRSHQRTTPHLDRRARHQSDRHDGRHRPRPARCHARGHAPRHRARDPRPGRGDARRGPAPHPQGRPQPRPRRGQRRHPDPSTCPAPSAACARTWAPSCRSWRTPWELLAGVTEHPPPAPAS